ncbi:ABC transporter substrate-binding protein/permease [Armatimonas rosea]|uniref:His/Glu/Gln/Arg/opine family amino acid ABC transporter permease subunit n=1 Tax=Armatimonas rosea TaxID=685828 RepID=A0A7W9SS20_ARMRO|nr:ABC transporter substrate-binding protein/permease [Armatimonas rosea]MBB6051355.1 His/Glu/Gln/Arg/opine family amino acid ABC transporter permease subunit [Armatimonas rosea]
MLRSLLALLTLCLALPTLARNDDSLARVKARGVLKLATDATYPPFEYMENGKVVGFDAELAAELGRELGVQVELVSMEWSGVFAAVETQKCDLVISGVTITAERKKGNGFTRPYFLSGQVIARKKGTSFAKPSDILPEGRTAAVQQETTGQFAMEKAGVPKERLHRFDTLQDGLMDVKNGKSDVAVGDEPALAEIIRKGYPELELAPGGPFVEENLGIVAKKDALTLLAALNLALERIVVDGRYARIYEKWMHKPFTLAGIAKLEAVKGDGTPIPAELLTTATKAVAVEAGAPAQGGALTIRPKLLLQSLPLLLKGALLTLELTLITLVLGVPLGLGIALVRLGRVAPLRTLAIAYVEAVRGTPLLMQIYVIYFVFPAVGISLNPFVAGVMALSLNAAAYASEIFRAGIESIDTGQREAARALGMTSGQAMRFVILPQTFQRVLPPLTNEAVALLKDSSLVSVVALTELMRVGKELATTAGAPTTIYLAVAVIYLAMTLPLTAIVRRLETHPLK